MWASGARLAHADELRVRAVAFDAEDAVADRELGDGRADGLDLAGELHAERSVRFGPRRPVK